jgi:hydroxymethylglutaryl-CoA lyase
MADQAKSPSRGYPTQVTVYEVGPREGLQAVSTRVVPVDRKARLVDELAAAGLREIETTGFFLPRAFPQLADAGKLMASLKRHPGVRYTAHVPNVAGYERARAAGCDAIVLCLAATDEFANHDQNDCNSTKDCLDRAVGILDRARKDKVWVRIFLTNAWVCPYSGPVDPERVHRLVAEVIGRGADEVCLADNVGSATPRHVDRLLERVVKDTPVARLALHFHDNRGTALANATTGLRNGVVKIDAGLGGLGARAGCRYIPTHPAMLATEDLVFMLDGMGIQTGVNLEALRTSALALRSELGVTLPGRYVNSGPLALEVTA